MLCFRSGIQKIRLKHLIKRCFLIRAHLCLFVKLLSLLQLVLCLLDCGTEWIMLEGTFRQAITDIILDFLWV